MTWAEIEAEFGPKGVATIKRRMAQQRHYICTDTSVGRIWWRWSDGRWMRAFDGP